MLLRKPTVALCASSGVFPVLRPVATATASPCRRLRPPAGGPWATRARGRRLYATIHNSKRGQGGKIDDCKEPKWPTTAHPTPYEILGLARDAPYSKTRYFQLAKHYHPDRQHHTSDDGVSHGTKLERYRLVVAANALLSNPQKKRMYDLYGFGWDVSDEVQSHHREADRAWRHEPGNASMNATWEDWERWRRARDGSEDSREKQEQVFTSNLAFMAIVSTFLIVGTWSQMTRAGTNSVTLLEMRDQTHAAVSNELRQRQSQRRGLDRDARIESFLRQRELEKWAHDPPGHGLPAPASEVAEVPVTPSRLRG